MFWSSFPIYTAVYLALTFCLKAFQLMLVLSERPLAASFYKSLPFVFVQDTLIALGLFVIFDWGVFWTIQASRRGIKTAVHLLANTVFALMIFYTCFSFKFYSLFGTHASYGVLIQADHVMSFQEGFFKEMDAFFWLLVAAGAFLILVTVGMTQWAHKQYAQWRAKNPPQFIGIVLKRKSQGLILAVYLLLAMPFSSQMLSGVNWYALDKNPVYELISSTRAGLGKMKPQRSAGLEATGPVAAGSVVLSQKPCQRIAFKSNNLALRDNLNVVFVKMESTTRNYLGHYNPEFKPFTPNLDALIQSSVVLENHYCQEPASLKGLYSIIMGKFPYQTRNWKDFIERAKTDVSLPEILRQQGFHTAFFTSSDGRIYSQNTLLQGRFDEMVDMNEIAKKNWDYHKYPIAYDDGVLIRLFDEYVAKQTQRFFVVLAPHVPHHPYTLADSRHDKIPGVSRFDKYKNSLSYSDFILGEILAVLKKRGLENNTLLVVMADHGEAFNQHPRNYIHSIYLYEENVRTYCIFHQPLLLEPGTYSDITQHVDILPTVLDLLNLALPGGDGVSLGSVHSAQCVFFYTSFNDLYLGLRDGPMKYILNRRYHTEELFDLQADPEEKNNLAASRPDLCRKFKSRLISLEKQIQ